MNDSTNELSMGSDVDLEDASHDDIEIAQDPRNAERQARKRQRRIDALTWVPSESTARIMQSIEIGSQPVRKSWNEVFARAQSTLHMLQQIVPSSGQMEQSRGIEQVLNDRLTALETDLRAEMERLRHLAKHEGIETIPPKDFTQSQSFDVAIYTQGAARYLRVIVNVDELFWMIDYLWIQGVLKNDHRWQLTNQWKKKLWENVMAITQLWKRARSALRETQLAKNAKLAAKRNRTESKVTGQDGGESEEGQAVADAPAEIAAAAA